MEVWAENRGRAEGRIDVLPPLILTGGALLRSEFAMSKTLLKLVLAS